MNAVAVEAVVVVVDCSRIYICLYIADLIGYIDLVESMCLLLL
jgi:hypothetical protein